MTHLSWRCDIEGANKAETGLLVLPVCFQDLLGEPFFFLKGEQYFLADRLFQGQAVGFGIVNQCSAGLAGLYLHEAAQTARE